ncbi:beta-ketoacyl synthase N-terminal-like domain-containing protein [Micromonospora sp. WMMA1363]|uniref:beta-ketoacyl synthase N-terminal-like domain-containing protein n=1 Tax=Micromonospora sp. WMMA1363 TaxID=3053985 RepID=UPI00259D2A01|nr:beta-ketoacyl synthase N-terminal-like domain-containing protein [Micromonospora sp. WMMA1363]MDM4718155.1 beta-ketoacyl synthase N-terminal-like domain-containing protein [Micromonospora sp. WMMA1363]
MNVVISGLAVVSPYGLGTGAFAAGRRAARPAATRGEHPPVARLPELTGEDFTPNRRVRLKERSSALAVGTVGALLATYRLDDVPVARRGLVLGSALASLDSYLAVSGGSLAGAKPHFIDHNLMPPGIMNYTSSQAAIRFDLRGPNVTVTAGRATGLTALGCARRLVAAGRADAVLAGAFEALSPRRLRLESAADRATPLPAEGCCVFLVETAATAERAGRRVLATPLALTAGFFPEPDEGRTALHRTVTRALGQAGVAAGDVATVVRGAAAPGRYADDETTVLADIVPDAPVLDPAARIGDTYGASAAFGVAGAIVDAQVERTIGVTLVTSIDPDGQVAAAVLAPGSRVPHPVG